jgi:thiamine-monophosphate kinase
MKEADLIRELAAGFRRSPAQLNGLFECDAEIILLGGRPWGLTLDDFSPEEDLFTLAEPERLGRNLAVATLSDLLAAGVEPAFFMQAVSLPADIPPAVLRGLSGGIRAVLDEAGCALIGGDTGASASWRYCGFAMGPVAEGRPLMRRLPAEPQSLWVTGLLGDANLAAFQRAPPPLFELRLAEARALRKHASACMDTSGGLFDALWTLHALSPGLRLTVDAAVIPLAPAVRPFSAAAGIPPGAALLGGAGEYELLAALPDSEAAAAADWTRRGLTRIGRAEPGAEAGLFVRRENGEVRPMAEPPPCPRSARDHAGHAREVVQMAVALFGGQPE